MSEPRSIQRLLLGAMMSLIACDDDSVSSAAGSTGSSTSSGGAGGEQAEALYLSIVAEEGPGVGPAKLRLVNDTEAEILSMTLPTGEAFAFYEVGPGTESQYAIVASDDMVEDAILSVHTLDTCVRRPFSEISGPTSLEAGRAYSLHVSQPDGYVGDIVEEPTPEAYVGIRAVVVDSSKPAELGAVPILVLSDQAGELTLEDVYKSLPAPFTEVDVAELMLDEVRFIDRAGQPHRAEGPFNLSGAFGYSFHIGALPVEGALHEVLLTP